MARLVVVNKLVLIYLYQAGGLDVLRSVYGEVSVPSGVVAEIDRWRARGANVPQIESYQWIKVLPSHDARSDPDAFLTRGDWEGLTLAAKTPDSLFIAEGLHLRKLASRRGIAMSGCLGVLLFAHRKGLIVSMEEWLGRMRKAGMLISPRAWKVALRLAKNSEP